MVVIWGSGSTMARMSHAHLGTGGPFESCRLCHAFTWAPDAELGAMVTGPGGRVAESEAARRLLAP